MKPQSAKAKWREPKPEKHYTGKELRPFNKYRHAKSLADYFEQRVTRNTGCWTFNTAGDKDGYPQVIGSKHCKQLGLTRAHQVSWYLYHGEIPDDKLVCHTCDNPACVNPEHLFLGTCNDNVQDMMHKGRYRHPKELGKHKYKLTKEMVEDIKKLHKQQSCFTVAKTYGISFSLVCRVWRGQSIGY